jgi:polyisoprenoid-binding protein YceI
MKKVILFLSFAVLTGSIFAQKKTTTSATVTFDATTPKDALPKAENNAVIAAVDTKTGSVAFEASVKNFAFTNAMIQDHFNGEKWFNSDTYPKFTFKGQIADPSKVNFSKDGTYEIAVKGDLTVKDVTKPITVPATVVIAGGKISATSSFTINLADFNISGAPIDGGKVAKEPKITVSADLK